MISCVATKLSHAPSASCPPAGLFPAGTVASIQSNDFDEIASLPPLWEQQYSQIGRGPFAGGAFMALTAELGVGFERFSVGMMIRGSIPRGCGMVAIPFHCGGKSAYQGERLLVRSALVV